jgi:hypothetical protein
MSTIEKHPAGLTPEFIYKEYRFHDIQKAVLRYFYAGLTVPPEWIKEYNEIALWFQKRNK